MRTRVIIIFFLVTTTATGQLPDSISTGTTKTLSRQEVDFLNSALANTRDTFDFSNKKIAFVTGPSGDELISKRNYFLTVVKPFTDRGILPQIWFVRLTAEEKQKSNGYDALVLSLVKMFTEKQRKKIIEQLSKIE